MVSVAQQPLPRPCPLQLPSPITQQSWSLCPCVTLSVSAFIEHLALPGTGPSGGNRLGVGGGSATPHPHRLLCRWLSVSMCLHMSVCFGLPHPAPHPELLRPGPPRHLPGLFPLRCQMQRPVFYVVVRSYIFLWRLEGEGQVGTCEMYSCCTLLLASWGCRISGSPYQVTGLTLKPSCPQPQDWDSVQSECGLAEAFRRNLELLGCVHQEGTGKLSLSPSVGSWPPGLICHPSKRGGGSDRPE